MPALEELTELIYLGNLSLSAGIDYSNSILSATYGGGYREDETIFPGLRRWSLRYNALMKGTFVYPDDAAPVERLEYVWNFYCDSKDNGNRPFKVRCPRDGKLYLAVFSENNLDIELVDYRLRTTGLKIEQVSVVGITVNADGSIPEGGS